MKKNYLSLILLFCALNFGFGQVSTGDLAFVQYNADGDEIIKLLVLVDINAGESIDITDNGWLSSGSFRTGEGTYNYTVPAGGHSCGDIITIDLSGVALSGSGDQLIVYQGSTMITAINSEGAGVWQADATNANTSALPTGLTNGTNAVALNEIDNAMYNGTLVGTIATLRAAIHDNSNWIGDNTTVQDFTSSFSISDCGGIPSCAISDIGLTNTGTCNDNGTASDASDDYYTADVIVTYSTPPASGTIDLSGTGVVGGTTSVAITSSPQTITGVQLVANGSDVEIIATFSDETSCNYTETVVGSGVTSCSFSGGTVCVDESFISAGDVGPSYGTINWTGDDGIDWTATDARSDRDIGTDEAIMIRSNNSGVLSNDTSFTNGVGTISFNYARVFTGDSTIQLWINGTQYGGDINVTDTSASTFSATLNIPGNIDLEIRNTSTSNDRRALISNLTWTCFVCTGAPADATNFVATDGCGGIDLTWDAPSCADELFIVARETNAVTVTPSGDGSAYTADTQFGNGTALAAGEFAVYQSSGTSTSITGLTGGNTYHFTIFSRIGSTWSTGATANVTYSGTVENPSSFTSFNDCGDIGLQWTNPSCFDEVLVVARAANAVTATPTGDGSAYTADAQFGNGTALSTGEYAVYKDVSDNVTVTGLTDGTTYHFEIFTRVGSNWSSGVTTSATASSSGGSGPTTFSPGDIVFVGYDSYVGGATDRYALLNLVDIGVGTEFIMANLVYEWNAAADTSTNRWYSCDTDFDDDPRYASITYNGCADIPKGSIICLATSGSPGDILYMTVNGVSVSVGTTGTEDFVVDATNNSVGNISTSSADAMWLMQGSFSNVFSDIGDGDDTGTADDRYRTFSGTVLGALQTKGDFQAFNVAGDNGGTRVSRIHPDVECVFLQTGTTSAERFYGYHNGITSGTQYQILADITDQSNWILQSGNSSDPVQPLDNIDFLCGSSYTITGSSTNAGLWVGAISDDWFDCRNWENFAVPSASVDVTIDGTATTNSKIDHNSTNAAKFGGVAECNNLTITGSSLDISESNLNILTVNADLTIDGSGLLDMDDGDNGTNDGIINLYGNWINTIDETAFSEGNSTVVFASAIAQSISFGGPPIPPGPFETEEFYNITLDNDFDIDINSGGRALYAHGDLTINTGHTLTVQSGSFVHVGNILNTQGAITLEDSANLIQVNDVDNIGNLTMRRNFSVDSNLDYVYWSSPVTGFSTNDLPVGSIYVFAWNPIAPNTGNGQGNWESAVGQTMVEGMGYIARSPVSVPSTQVFENGVPHNGDVDLNLSRGTTNASDDDDWNLLGNPYPSSISAIAFLTANTNLEGFINLWTHGTPPSDAIPDPFYENNNGSNYDPNDYITYNSTGVTSGPGTFNGYIAAGQSFFVNTVDGAASTTIGVSFTNAMRQSDYDNSNFFRSTDPNPNEKHRIWLDLTSDAYGNDRILLGYMDGATDEEDRLFDALTTMQDGVQNFYSIIDQDPFAIQGKGLPFTDTDVIPLGFKCVTAGDLSIGIHTVDGLFADGQNIYLKDNDLNVIHNLSNAPYAFISDAGEFNDRFEIVFNEETLSIDDHIIDPNALSIIELPNGDVQIRISQPLTIKAVTILDILGRQVYQLEGTNATETYNLSQLSKAAYIAKVTLSNGQVISKKAIKQH